MHRISLAALAFTLLILPISGCSSPEEYQPPGTQSEVDGVDSGEARAVVDQFLAALVGGDMQAAGTLLVGRAMEASRTLSGASSVTLVSVAEDASVHDPEARIFEVQADVTYPESGRAQSGVYTYRLRVTRTEAGLRIENLGP